MIDIKLAIQNTATVEESLNRRSRPDLIKFLHEMVAEDEQRKKKILEVENLKAERNKASEQIAALTACVSNSASKNLKTACQIGLKELDDSPQPVKDEKKSK